MYTKKAQLKPVTKMRQQLIRSISVLLLILVITNIALFDYSARISYIEQIKVTQQHLSEQVGITFETFLRYVADIVNKSTVFDFTAYDINDAHQNPYDFGRGIISALDSLLATNSMLLSACIYFPELDQVYDTRMIRSHITALENFTDKEIFKNYATNHLVLLEPRASIQTSDIPSSGMINYHVITMIAPTTLKNSKQTSYLAVNINADRLYNSVKRNLEMNDDIHFFVYGTQSTVILSNTQAVPLESLIDEAVLNQKNIAHASVLHGYGKSWTSIYFSTYLGWAFVIESFLQPVNMRLPWFSTLNLAGLALILALVITFIIRKTEPAQELAQTAVNSQWKDILSCATPLHTVAAISDDMFYTKNGNWGCITCLCNQSACANEWRPPKMQDYEQLCAQCLTDHNVHHRLIWMGRELLCAVILMEEAGTLAERQLQTLASALYRRFQANGCKHVQLSVSLPQASQEMLPLCYQQCQDALRYRICLNTPVLFYADLTGRDTQYDFGEEMVTHIKNNISIGNKEVACALFCQLFAPLEEGRVLIDNIHLVGLMAGLQNELVAIFPGLLFPPEKLLIEYQDTMTQQTLKETMLLLIDQLCGEAIRSQKSREQQLRLAAVQYIDDHFCSPEITLIQIAEALGINKTLCSRLIREAVGETFPEYLNHRRVAHAKLLLEDTHKTVENIAMEVGYSYSYYFIKVFKQSEGITPGQYRSNLTQT